MDSFTAFFVGVAVGLIVGIMFAGFLVALNRTEERREKELNNETR